METKKTEKLINSISFKILLMEKYIKDLEKENKRLRNNIKSIIKSYNLEAENGKENK